MRKNLIRIMGLGIFIGTYVFGISVYADTYGKINNENVVIKEAPSIESADVQSVEKDKVIRVGNQIDDYTEVILEDETIVYIETKFIDLEEKEQEEVKVEEKLEVAQPKLEKGEEVVKEALKYVGNPYVYGGNSLTNGTDCSGFSSSIYKKFGVNLQRSSKTQYTSNGTHVKKSELKAGDLVFYGYNGSITHVAIYIGDDKIVHASTPKTGICVSPLEQRGMNYIGAKRVI